MPIFYDRIADQVEELLPEFYLEDGPRFVSFLKSYFEFLEKGQLVYKNAADIDYVGLEDGTTEGEAFSADGTRGNLIQEAGTYAPSSITNAKINYEIDVDTDGAQKTSFETGEYVVGSSSGAIARIDVIGSSFNLYIEQFSEAQFDIDEVITGMTSGMIADVARFNASPLHAVNNLLSYSDIDKTSGDFLEYFRRDFMPFIDRDVLANKRLLNKHIKDLYLAKGTNESYEFLFRILYGLEASISFPTENVIRPSESEYSEPTVMRVYSTSDLSQYVKGTLSRYNLAKDLTGKAIIAAVGGMSGTNDGANAYEIVLDVPHLGTFVTGDSLEVTDRDGLRTVAYATVRGIMSDINPDDGSTYLGMEDGAAGNSVDIIRLEDNESFNVTNEDGSGDDLLGEDESNLVLEYGFGGQLYEAQPFALESGTGVGVLLTEESVYDIDGNLITDYVLVNEQTSLYPHVLGAPDARRMGNGVYHEGASVGSLYSESDTFNYVSPVGDSATQSINVIGATGRGGITDIVIDNPGSEYSNGDVLVFVTTNTDGSNTEASIMATDSNIELEAASAYGDFIFTASANQTLFTGFDNNGVDLSFNPKTVEVYINGTLKSRFTDYSTDHGAKITFSSGLSNNDSVEIVAARRRLTFEVGTVAQEGGHSGSFDNPIYIAHESDGAIARINLENSGVNYKSLPLVFVGGYLYYDTLTTGTILPVGNTVTSTNSITMVVAKHDTIKKRLLVYKRSTDVGGVPTGTITMSGLSATDNGGSTSTTFTITQTNVTPGYGATLYAYSTDIGSIKKLKMQDVGHLFVGGGIGNYQQHAIIKTVSSAPTVNQTVTALESGTTANIDAWDGNRNLISLSKVRGEFEEGEHITSSDAKTFILAKTSPATARGRLAGEALLDGNYTNDTGFPSVDSQRIHDGGKYQDYSYVIKVGESINKYRSIIKSLLSPAGTIFFGEVSIRNNVIASPSIYNVNFDGTTTTRAFIPKLIIGSKIDVADIELEDGTVSGAVMVLESPTITGNGSAGVYTITNPTNNVGAEPGPGTGLSFTLQLTNATTLNAAPIIIARGFGYKTTDIRGDIITIYNSQVGGIGTSTVFATFQIEQVGSPLENNSSETFVGTVGRVTLEDSTGIITTERYLALTANTVVDQASGQGYVAGTSIQETDVDFFNRELEAEVRALGSRVVKELDIFPAYNQHKIYYTTLDNALAVGTTVKSDGGARAIVMEHDTTNKFIIVHRDGKDQGDQSSQFSGSEAIEHIATGANYFTSTSIELHWVPEDIPVYTIESTPTADSYTITQAQKTAAQGGAEPYAHADYISGYAGRGKVLVAGDHSETYDSEMRQRHINIISSPLYTSGSTQRGRVLVGLNHTKTPFNQRGAESYVAGDTSTTVHTSTTILGDTSQPYTAINGTALRLDDVRNSVTSLPGDSSATTHLNADGTSRQGVALHGGTNWGYRPAGQKLFESTNVQREQLITEAGNLLIFEPDIGQFQLESGTHTEGSGPYVGFKGNLFIDPTSSELIGELLLEDGGSIHLEDATMDSLSQEDEVLYQVSEETTQLGSYNIVDETDGAKIIFEDGFVIINEEALMMGQKESNQVGPTISDLGKMIFAENYAIMAKIQQEGNTDDLLMETGDNLIIESPSEGIKINDISTMYPRQYVSTMHREFGRKTNLTYSASVQTG